MFQIKFPCAQWLLKPECIMHSGFKYRETERCFNKKKFSPFGKGVLTLLKVFQVWDLLVVITTSCFFFFFPSNAQALKLWLKLTFQTLWWQLQWLQCLHTPSKIHFKGFTTLERMISFWWSNRSCQFQFPNTLQISRFSNFSNKENVRIGSCSLSSMHHARGWTKGVIGKTSLWALGQL